jgi:hypothetical protein
MSVTPQAALLDQPVKVSVRGLRGEARTTIIASATDAGRTAGRRRPGSRRPRPGGVAGAAVGDNGRVLDPGARDQLAARQARPLAPRRAGGTLIGALEELRGFLGGQKATLVWDGLPGYAPELNPVEGLWANLKGVEPANLAADALEDIVAAAERGIQRIRATHGLASSFLRHCGLSL